MRLVDIWYLHMAYENQQGFKTCQTGKYGTSEVGYSLRVKDEYTVSRMRYIVLQ